MLPHSFRIRTGAADLRFPDDQAVDPDVSESVDQFLLMVERSLAGEDPLC